MFKMDNIISLWRFVISYVDMEANDNQWRENLTTINI